MRSLKINKCRDGNVCTKRKKEFSLILAVFSLAIFFIGCTNDSYVNSPEPVDQYTLNITLQAPGLSGRSGDHSPEGGTEAESYINVSGGDYAVFLLDQDGKYLQQFEPGQVIIKQNPTGKYYEYLLSGVFQRPADEVKSIQLLVLANWRNKFGGSYNSVDDFLADKKSLENLYTESESFNFTLPKASEGSAWTPDGSTDGIPMVGLSTAVAFSKENQVIDLDYPVQMLRSLAKIEIRDMVPGGKANIDKCVLTTYNTSGRFIPDGSSDKNPDWNIEQIQVVSPSLPTSVRPSTNLQFASRKESVKIEGQTMDKDIFEVYIPEMDFKDLSQEEYPRIDVYIADQAYPIYLGEYDSQTGKVKKEGEKRKLYEHLLRNHIYRYNITGVGLEMDLGLYIETPDWDVDDDQEWTFEDALVEFTEGGKFTWINPEYEQIIDDPERILLIGYQPEDAAYGSFQFKPIAANNRCTWTLSLIADDDTKNDHFNIQLKNGEVWEDCGDTVTRDLDANKVEFRIKATEANGSTTDYSARVTMSVQTFDGRAAIVNLTGTTVYNSTHDKFYYVVKQITDGTDNM